MSTSAPTAAASAISAGSSRAGSIRTEAIIDTDAIAANTGVLLAALRRHRPDAQLMAVVKADGYGHGMIPAAHAAVAGGADWLGVVHEHEALALRQAGITTRVLSLLGAPGGGHEAAIRGDVDLTDCACAD